MCFFKGTKGFLVKHYPHTLCTRLASLINMYICTCTYTCMHVLYIPGGHSSGGRALTAKVRGPQFNPGWLPVFHSFLKIFPSLSSCTCMCHFHCSVYIRTSTVLCTLGTAEMDFLFPAHLPHTTQHFIPHPVSTASRLQPHSQLRKACKCTCTFICDACTCTFICDQCTCTFICDQCTCTFICDTGHNRVCIHLLEHCMM